MWTAVGVCVGAAYGLTLGAGFIFILTMITQILGADVWLVIPLSSDVNQSA